LTIFIADIRVGILVNLAKQQYNRLSLCKILLQNKGS
jgi:hypothetical protein